MGAKMVTPTKVGTTDYGCKADADCYKANGLITLASTDAEKKKRCCMYYEVVTAPSGTNKATGDTELLAYKTSYGLPTTAGEATKYCNLDYPTSIAALKVLQPSYSASTGEFTADSASGAYKVKTYCDGSAAALQVAAVVGAAVTISMY